MIKYIILLMTFALIYSCTSPKQIQTPPRKRAFKEWKAERFHNPIELKIGWYLYEENEVEKDTQKWSVITDSTTRKSAIPVIIVSYPDSNQQITFNMEIDEALFGKLIKHTLMTQEPIKRPYAKYLEKADCAKCHPSNIKLPKTKWQLDRIREMHKSN